jgi:hypothetical protein
MKKILMAIVLFISSTLCSFGQATSALLDGDVVINKIYNSGEASGANDAIELLVIKHASDLRGLQIVDFSPAGKNGRQAVRKLSQNNLFAAVRAGTLIVIRNRAVSTDYTLKDAGDFNLDIGMQDANFVTYVTGPTFDVFNDDMVILSRDGNVGTPIAVLGNGPGTSLSFAACNTTFFRLNDPVITAAGTFVYVTSPTSAGGYVYNAAKTKSNVTLNNDATPTPLKLGKHNNATNATYIKQLRMISPSYLKYVDSIKAFFAEVDLTKPEMQPVENQFVNGFYPEAVDAYINLIKTRTDRNFFYRLDGKTSYMSSLQDPLNYSGTLLNAFKNEADTKTVNNIFYQTTGAYPQGQIDWQTGININRMTYLTNMGLVYWAYPDPKYSTAFVNIITDFIDHTTVPTPPTIPNAAVYTSPIAPYIPYRVIDLASRLEEWMRSYYYFMGAPEFTSEKQLYFLKRLMDQLIYLNAYNSAMGLGNWNVSAAKGTVIVTAMFPEWKKATTWMNYSLGTFENNLLNFTNADGFQKELDEGYHKLVLEDIAKSQYLLTQLNSLPALTTQALDKVKLGYSLLKSLVKPSGSDPVIGDLTVIHKQPLIPDNFIRDASYTYPVLLFSDQLSRGLGPVIMDQRKYIALGKSAFDQYQSITKTTTDFTSNKLAGTGFLVMRSGKGLIGEEKNYGSLYCLFDNAIFGAGSHSHFDYLNLELFAYDKTLLIDPGRGWGSYQDTLLDTYYRTVKAHNVIQVGTNDTDKKQVTSVSDIYNDAWNTNKRFDYARGVLKNYNSTGITTTRELFFVKGEYWFLKDKVSGGTVSVPLKQYFHTWADTLITDNAEQSIRTNYQSVANLWIAPVQRGDGLTLTVDNSGYVANTNNTASISAPIITYAKTKGAGVDANFEALLYPVKKGELSVTSLNVNKYPNASGAATTNVGFLVYITKNGSTKTDHFFASEDLVDRTFGNSSGVAATVNNGLAFCRDNASSLLYHISLQGRKVTYKNFTLELPQDTASAYIEILGQRDFEYFAGVANSKITFPYSAVPAGGFLVHYIDSTGASGYYSTVMNANSTVTATVTHKGYVTINTNFYTVGTTTAPVILSSTGEKNSTLSLMPSSTETVESSTKLMISPNPVNNQATISVYVPYDEQQISIDLYGLNGNKIENLYKGKASGKQLKNIDFNGSNYPSGVYFIRLITSSSVKNLKIILNHY